MVDTSDELEFDIALSFAGEDRQIAEELAFLLTKKGLKVFYDKYEQATLWGKNLYDHLADVYSNKARYCIMLLSRRYSEKAWTTLERQHAQARAFRERQEYILPLRLDDTHIPGIADTVGYIDLRVTSVEEVAKLALSKLTSAHDVRGSFAARSGPAENSNTTFEFKVKHKGNRLPPPQPGERWRQVSSFRAGKSWLGIDSPKDDFLSSLEWDPSSKLLASIQAAHGYGRIWNLNGTILSRLNPGRWVPKLYLSRVAFKSSDYPYLLAAAGRGKLFVWSTTSGYLDEPFAVFDVCSERHYVTALSWEPAIRDKSLIALSVSLEERGLGRLMVCDVGRQEIAWSADTHVSYRLEWSPDGQTLSVPKYDGDDVKLFDASGRPFDIPFFDNGDPWYRPKNFAWHPSGLYYATETSSESVGIFEASSGNCQQLLEIKEANGTRGIQWSPDGKYIAVATTLGVVEIFDLVTSKIVREFFSATFGTNDHGWSPDGQRLLLLKNGLTLCDPLNGSEIATWKSEHGGFQQYLWSPDGGKLAYADQKGFATIKKLEC